MINNDRLYKHLSMPQRLEKAAMINSMVDELTKIAQEEEKKKSEPPEWAKNVADIGGFLAGSAVGAYTGDILAHKLVHVKNKNVRNMARYLGQGLIAYGTYKAIPKLRRAAPDIVKDILDEPRSPKGA